MILDILLKKVVREKDSRVFSHSRFKQFFVASRAYQEVDVVPDIPFVRLIVRVREIYLCMACVCI